MFVRAWRACHAPTVSGQNRNPCVDHAPSWHWARSRVVSVVFFSNALASFITPRCPMAVARWRYRRGTRGRKVVCDSNNSKGTHTKISFAFKTSQPLSHYTHLPTLCSRSRARCSVCTVVFTSNASAMFVAPESSTPKASALMVCTVL